MNAVNTKINSPPPALKVIEELDYLNPIPLVKVKGKVEGKVKGRCKGQTTNNKQTTVEPAFITAVF